MKKMFLMVKIILTLLIGYILLSKINYHMVVELLNNKNGLQILVWTILIVLIQGVIGGSRLVSMLDLYKKKLTLFDAWKIWMIGSFFAQTMISFVGGDFVRVLCFTRRALNTKVAVNLILLDRTLGLLSLSTLYLLIAPFVLFLLTPSFDLLFYFLILFYIGNLFVIALYGLLIRFRHTINRIKKLTWLSDFSLFSYNFLIHYKNSITAYIVSIGVHFLSILVIYIFAVFYQVEISFFTCAMLSIPILLISMLPISIGGWGVREGAMVIGFGLVGIQPEKAIAVSISFGLVFLIGSIPGGLLFLLEDKQKEERIA